MAARSDSNIVSFKGLRRLGEPDNPVDGNAVAVIYSDTFQRETIGYLRREHAARYQQLISQLTARRQRAICNAKLFGGTREKRHIGVWLDLEAPTIIATRLNLQYRRVRKPKPEATRFDKFG